MRRILKRAFPETLPVLAGYIFLGIAYGIAMKVRGFHVLWSISISVFVYGGSLQFAMLEPMSRAAEMFAPLTLFFLALLVQARHLFYGLTMLEPYNRAGAVRPYVIFAMSDETYSLVCSGAPRDLPENKWYAAITALDQFYWVAGTVIGALLGEMIPVEYLTGIDFSMTALFVVIMTDQTRGAMESVRDGSMTLPQALFPPLLGLFGTLLGLLLAGRDSFLLFAMAVILLGFGVFYQTDRKSSAKVQREGRVKKP
ncbi:MAG: AzlC family ABC transporter permease [Clostridia bacterium]|nr:AzlC family ABC transporter permease [Clostridia bacterium]